jgi:hypothetical protein
MGASLLLYTTVFASLSPHDTSTAVVVITVVSTVATTVVITVVFTAITTVRQTTGTIHDCHHPASITSACCHHIFSLPAGADFGLMPTLNGCRLNWCRWKLESWCFEITTRFVATVITVMTIIIITTVTTFAHWAHSSRSPAPVTNVHTLSCRLSPLSPLTSLPHSEPLVTRYFRLTFLRRALNNWLTWSAKKKRKLRFRKLYVASLPSQICNFQNLNLLVKRKFSRNWKSKSNG